MSKIAIAVHGGAGPDSEFIRKHVKEYEQGLAAAVHAGYTLLEKGASSVDAVEAAIRTLENNPIFNAGRGSALNEKGEVEMCASIMNGQDKNAGAVALIKKVKNPISLARQVMEKTKHTYLGGDGALEFARQLETEMEPDSYFITEHMYEEFEKARQEETGNTATKNATKKHGTVGAVALDASGNIAAGTSTGGLEFCKAGRIADSSMIGVGTYADNQTCGVSTTGEGEFHIQHVTAFQIASLMEYKGLNLRDACHFLIHEKCKHVTADMGLIAIDREGNLVAEFNTQRMHRGMRSSSQELFVQVYP